MRLTISGGKETVPCKYCGKDTTSVKSMTCDSCWELFNKIRYFNIDVLKKILMDKRGAELWPSGSKSEL